MFNFHPDTRGVKVVTYLGSLVQSCSGEGGTPQTNISGVCGECSQCLGHTGFAPIHAVCAFPFYTAQAPGCPAGEPSKRGPGLHALSRSKRAQVLRYSTQAQTGLGLRFVPFPGQLRRPGAWRACSPNWVVVLSPPRSQTLGFLGAPSRVCRVSPLGSWSLSAALLVDVNHPRSQENLVSNWEPVHSLVEHAVSGAKISPLALLPTWGRASPQPLISAAPLWCLLSPLFCERVRLSLRAFCRKVISLSLFFFFSSLAIPQFGLLSHVNSLRMSSGHSGLAPTLYMQPPLTARGCKWPGYLSTGSRGSVHNLWVLFFSPPSYVALRDSETPHRRTGERVSWCLETSPPS